MLDLRQLRYFVTVAETEHVEQRIRLTADGRVFRTEARALLQHAERLESLGARLGRGEAGGLWDTWLMPCPRTYCRSESV